MQEYMTGIAAETILLVKPRHEPPPVINEHVDTQYLVVAKSLQVKRRPRRHVEL